MVGRILPHQADAFALIVRGHILLEHGLIELLRHALPKADMLRSRLSYQHRLELNTATGLLGADLRPYFEQVAELRNRYAHDLNFEFTASDQTALLKLLPEPALKLVDELADASFPDPLRTSLMLAYFLVEMARKNLIDDEAGLGVIGKKAVRWMLKAALDQATQEAKSLRD